MSVHVIVCREFAELATEYVEGALPAETLEPVEEHLAVCDSCRTYGGQLALAATAVAGIAGVAGDATPSDETLGALMTAFRDRGGRGSSRSG